jgi:ferredoxin-fold anticodon binding domain-containing protein
MSLDNLTFGEIKQLANLFNNNQIKNTNPMIGKYCVIRTYSAGVHIGTVESINGKEILLKNARRIWKWNGAFTLSEVSLNGLDPENSRISETVNEIFITEAIEIIPATEKAIKTFEACHE